MRWRRHRDMGWKDGACSAIDAGGKAHCSPRDLENHASHPCGRPDDRTFTGFPRLMDARQGDRVYCKGRRSRCGDRPRE